MSRGGGLALVLLAAGVAALFLTARRPTRPVDAIGDPVPRGAVARIGVARFRPLTAGAGFTPDGRSIVGGARDGYVHFFDAETGVETRRFAAHVDAQSQPGQAPLGVVLFALSPDGRQAATSGMNQFRIWDVATGERIASWNVNGIPQIAWLPDGSGGWASTPWISRWRLDAPGAPGSPGTPMPVVTRTSGALSTPPRAARFVGVGDANGKGGVVIVDVLAGTERRIESDGPFESLREAPDGTRLALVAGKPSVVRVLDSADLREIARFAAPATVCRCAGWTPDGAAMFLSSAESSWLVDPAGRTLRQIPVAYALDVAWSPDGRRAVARTLAGAAVLDTATWTRVDLALDVRTDSFAFLPGSHTLVVGAAAGLEHWDADTGRRLKALPPLDPAPVGVRFETGGRLVLAWNWDGVRILDAATGEVVGRGANTRSSSSWVLGARGHTPLLLTETGLAPALVAADGTSTPLGGIRSGGRHAAFLPAGDRLLFVDRGGVTIHDATTGARVGTLGLVQAPNGVVPALDGKRVAVSSEDGVLRVIDAATGDVVWQHGIAPQTWGPPMAISPDGMRVAWAVDDTGGLRLVDLRRGGDPHAVIESVALPRHALGVTALAFSPDGRLLASGGGEGTILVWDVAAALRE